LPLAFARHYFATLRFAIGVNEHGHIVNVNFLVFGLPRSVIPKGAHNRRHDQVNISTAMLILHLVLEGRGGGALRSGGHRREIPPADSLAFLAISAIHHKRQRVFSS